MSGYLPRTPALALSRQRQPSGVHRSGAFDVSAAERGHVKAAMIEQTFECRGMLFPWRVA
jgi:hypothetical protein